MRLRIRFRVQPSTQPQSWELGELLQFVTNENGLVQGVVEVDDGRLVIVDYDDIRTQWSEG